MKSDIIKLQKSININFINKPLLLQALTHKSANNKINNENTKHIPVLNQNQI